MRYSILLAIGIVLGTGLATAQTHHGITELTVKETVMFATDVKVGTTLLKAGEYRVECDGDHMKFFLMVAAKDADRVAQMTPVERSLTVGKGKKVFETECKGKALNAPRKSTEAITDDEIGSGVHESTTRQLKGPPPLPTAAGGFEEF